MVQPKTAALMSLVKIRMYKKISATVSKNKLAFPSYFKRKIVGRDISIQ